jgi:NADH-quinone oxidoreductase subunit G
VSEGDPVTVATDHGSITLPAQLADLPDGVVWLPGNSGPSTVRRSLGVGHGSVVTLRRASAGDALAADEQREFQ